MRFCPASWLAFVRGQGKFVIAPESGLPGESGKKLAKAAASAGESDRIAAFGFFRRGFCPECPDAGVGSRRPGRMNEDESRMIEADDAQLQLKKSPPPLETIVLAARPWLPEEIARRIKFRE
jgi:hypothetical protein